MEQKSKKQRSRKLREGVVVSNKMQNTVVVRVDRKMRHPKYEKVIIQSKKYYAHDAANNLQLGDVVFIEETRPISKMKRWRVVDVKK